jgi:hypothetical protein
MAYRDGLLPHGTPSRGLGRQRNYWERVIRDDGEHESAVRRTKYIRDNPEDWKGYRFNR